MHRKRGKRTWARKETEKYECGHTPLEMAWKRKSKGEIKD
jgi:hypothetical protein